MRRSNGTNIRVGAPTRGAPPGAANDPFVAVNGEGNHKGCPYRIDAFVTVNGEGNHKGCPYRIDAFVTVNGDGDHGNARITRCRDSDSVRPPRDRYDRVHHIAADPSRRGNPWSLSHKSRNRSVAHPPPIWWGLGHPAECGLLRLAPCGCPLLDRRRYAGLAANAVRRMGSQDRSTNAQGFRGCRRGCVRAICRRG